MSKHVQDKRSPSKWHIKKLQFIYRYVYVIFRFKHLQKKQKHTFHLEIPTFKGTHYQGDNNAMICETSLRKVYFSLHSQFTAITHFTDTNINQLSTNRHEMVTFFITSYQSSQGRFIYIFFNCLITVSLQLLHLFHSLPSPQTTEITKDKEVQNPSEGFNTWEFRTTSQTVISVNVQVILHLCSNLDSKEITNNIIFKIKSCNLTMFN